METLFLIIFLALAVILLFRYGSFLITRKYFDNDISNGKIVAGLIAILIIIIGGTYILLSNLASFDVVGSEYYIFYYLMMGIAYIYIHIVVLYNFLGLSMIDDVFNNSNRAAFLTIGSSLLGLSVMFAAANIGDGPGFWTVIFADFLGLVAYVVIMYIYDRFTRTLEHIQSDHNMQKGIRYSVFVLCLSSILAYGVQGDWTSFSYTVVEFFHAWPALILLILGLVLENVFRLNDEKGTTFFISAIYIGFTVLAYIYLVNAIDFVSLILGGY
ncbi:hypothetical protein [Acholeplasma hippikon]|nr:hypothetical protein [Acholeplasma hippikon]